MGRARRRAQLLDPRTDRVTEAEVTALIAERAEQLAMQPYLVNQTYSKTRAFTTPGFSDLVLFGHGQIIFAEVKLDYNEPQPAQVEFQRQVVKNGGLYVVLHNPDELLYAGENLGMWR